MRRLPSIHLILLCLSLSGCGRERKSIEIEGGLEDAVSYADLDRVTERDLPQLPMGARPCTSPPTMAARITVIVPEGVDSPSFLQRARLDVAPSGGGYRVQAFHPDYGMSKVATFVVPVDGCNPAPVADVRVSFSKSAGTMVQVSVR